MPALAAGARADLLVGVSAPLSGPQAAEGRALVQSARWAAEAINAAGGVGGEMLSIAAEDDGCDERPAAAAATRHVAQKAAIVIGHPCGSAALAAARIYAAAGVLFIAAAPRHPDLTRRRAGPTVFRLAGRDDLQSEATASYLAAAYAGRRIAVVHDRTRYARALAEGVRAGLLAKGRGPVPEFGIVGSSKDFATTVAGLRTHHAEVVYFAGFPSEAAALWPQLRAVGLAPDLVGSDALANAAAEIRPLADQERLRVRVVRPYSAADAVGSAPLRDRLVAAGLPPAPAAVAGYAALEAWAAAARDGNPREASMIANRLGGPPLQTIAGPIAFDGSGDALIPSFAVATLDGQGVTLETIVLPRNGSAERAALGAPASGTESTPAPVEAPRGAVGSDGDGAGAVMTPPKPGRPPPLPARHPQRKRSAAGPETTGKR